MRKNLSILFWQNPYLDEQVIKLLETNAEYQAASSVLKEELDRFQEKLDKEQRLAFLEYEEAENRLTAALIKGYYLFGLGLNKEIREAILPEIL